MSNAAGPWRGQNNGRGRDRNYDKIYPLLSINWWEAKSSEANDFAWELRNK